jgi:tRNA U34 5-methylaminomethyl-2-thiouridine-forming methyltransferase MnmC
LKIEIIKTDDGSNSLLNNEINETYHSTFGAIAESNHVFIKNGLERVELQKINILEIGFGTGLNTFLSAIYAEEKKIEINFTSIEKYPLDETVFLNLNYSQILGYSEIYKKIHSSEWNNNESISSFFNLRKIKQDLLIFNFNQIDNIDIVYFDAFSPSKQPEMWNFQIFEKIYKLMNFQGILVTYTSAGTVKMALRQAGFHVSRLTGPPGKHHMVIATKK